MKDSLLYGMVTLEFKVRERKNQPELNLIGWKIGGSSMGQSFERPGSLCFMSTISFFVSKMGELLSSWIPLRVE